VFFEQQRNLDGSRIRWALDGARRRSMEASAYISRRGVKVFKAKIFLYEWALTAKVLRDR
jgi:hypothetical protein